MATATKTQNLQTRTGNKVVVMFGGVPVGLAQSVDIQENYNLEPASGIGDSSVVEHVPGMATYSVHVEEMVLNTGSLRSVGIMEESADAVLEGNVFDLVFMAKGGAALRTVRKCSYDSGSTSIRKHQIVTSNATFKAISVTGTAI